MEYVTLGNSELKVSRICLGCMSFGVQSGSENTWILPYEDSKSIIAYALSEGINFFDTAMSYQNGGSEECLGRIMKDCNVKRDTVIIATKISPKGSNATKDDVSVCDYVDECVTSSLKRLQVDYIDLYILHWWDYKNPIEEYLASFHKHVQAGRIKYIGISNAFAYQIAKANCIAREKGYEQFVSVQSHYNLIMREDEREMIPFCIDENIALTPYSSLASGRLSRKPGEKSRRMLLDAFAKKKYELSADKDQGIIERVCELATKKNVSMSEVALAWLRCKNTIPTIGATKKSHVETAVKSVMVDLSADEMKYLEELYTPHKLVGVMAMNSADHMFGRP